MSRPKRVQQFIEKRITLPADLAARVDLELFSQIEGKVPFAAWQKLVTRLLEQWLLARQGGLGTGGSISSPQPVAHALHGSLHIPYPTDPGEDRNA